MCVFVCCNVDGLTSFVYEFCLSRFVSLNDNDLNHWDMFELTKYVPNWAVHILRNKTLDIMKINAIVDAVPVCNHGGNMVICPITLKRIKDKYLHAVQKFDAGSGIDRG